MLRELDQVSRERLHSRIFRPVVLFQFIAGGQHYAVDLKAVEGIACVKAKRLTDIGTVGKEVSIHFRCRDVPVMDIRQPASCKAEPHPFASVVVLKYGERARGILVDRIIRVSSNLIDGPSFSAEDSLRPYSFIDGVMKIDSECFFIVNVPLLLTEHNPMSLIGRA